MKKTISAWTLIGLLTAGFFYRLEIIEIAVSQAAEYFGWQIGAIEISHIDFDSIAIARLDMSYQDSALRLDTQISALQINFDWRSGNKYSLQAIDIEHISATIKANAVNGSSAGAAIDHWLAYAPVMAVSIHHADISYETDQARRFQFAGAVFKDGAFNLQGVVHTGKFPGAEIDFRLMEHDFELVINTQRSKQKIIAWQGRYFIEDKWLSVQWQGSLGLSALNAYLVSRSVPAYIRHDVSHIDAELELDLIRSATQLRHGFAMRADLESSAALNIHHADLSQVTLNIRSRCVAQGLAHLRCVLTQPQSAELALRRASGRLKDYLPDAERRFVVEINPQDRVVIDYSHAGRGRVHVQGDVNAYLHSASSALRLEASLARLWFVTDFVDWQFKGDYQTRLNIKALKQPWPAGWLLFSAQGEVMAAQHQIEVISRSGLSLIMRDIQAGNYSLDKLELKQTGDFTVRYDLADRQLRGQGLQFELASHGLAYDEAALIHAPLQIELKTLLYENTLWNISARLKNKNISLSRPGLMLSGADLFASLEVNNNVLNAAGGLLLAEQRNAVEFSLQQDFLNRRGFAGLQADNIHLSENKLIAQQISRSGLPLRLSGGTAQLSLDANWGAAPQIKAALSVTAASGDYAQNPFSNLTTSMAFANRQGWKLIAPATIGIESFNMGLPLADISIDLQALAYPRQAQPSIQISRFSAAVLDGSIYGRNINVDFNQTENSFSIYLSALSLEKLLALNHTRDLAASGYFDGELPVTVDRRRLLIENGWLKSDENGGFIKYTGSRQMLANNHSLRLVSELLEDFQYSQMSAQVGLNAQGSMVLATKLHGHSPNAAINKQVNLNFNVEFDLWKLLDSARVLTRIDQVSQQVISKQKP